MRARPPAEPHGRVTFPPLAAEVAAAVLGPPRLPAAAVEQLPLARRAAVGPFPVLLAAPPAGRLLLARALHALAGREGPLVAAAGRRPPLDRLPPGATLYVDLPALAPETALALEAVLDDGTAWVLAGTGPGRSLPSPFDTRFGAVVLAVPPLAARAAELPALAAATLERLARRAGRGAPRLTPAALACLAAHAWPGDVIELEAVLGRALLSTGGETIDADDLRFAPDVPGPPPPLAAPAGGPDLEYLLAELAHELRNPMVTIKTFARHLPQVLEDAELRTRFTALCDEAVARMDGLLENVLAFARLGPPRRQPLEVAALLDRVVAEAEPELAGRTVRVRQEATAAARCAADPEHLAYALKNLFAGVVREVPAREELVLDAAANGVVTLRFAAGGAAAERLRQLTAAGETRGTEGGAASTLADPTLLPLSFRLARAVLEANGGTLAVVADGGGTTTLVVRLPTAAGTG